MGEGAPSSWFAAGQARVAPLLPALRVAGFVGAVAIVAYIGVRAAGEVQLDEIAWWPLPFVLAAAATWWLLLARGWALLVAGRTSRRDISVWARTQTLRYVPGGVWAPATRLAVVRGGPLDKVSTVAGENLLSLCAALTVGGAALAASGRTPWIGLVAAVAVPLVAVRYLPDGTPLTRTRMARATVNYLLAFLAYALGAVLVQVAVSGSVDALAVAGAASVAWAAGLVVVIAPSGLGVREVVYVKPALRHAALRRARRGGGRDATGDDRRRAGRTPARRLARQADGRPLALRRAARRPLRLLLFDLHLGVGVGLLDECLAAGPAERPDDERDREGDVPGRDGELLPE